MFLFLFINFLVVIGVSKMKYDNHGLINDKKKKNKFSKTTCTKKFWNTNLEKDLLNIKCISNTVKYKI
jgi:hypothetical protein